MAGHDDNQLFLNCSRCGLSIRTRFVSVQMEHCPRCLARARVLQPLFSSPMPMRTLRAARPDRQSHGGGLQIAEEPQ